MRRESASSSTRPGAGVAPVASRALVAAAALCTLALGGVGAARAADDATPPIGALSDGQRGVGARPAGPSVAAIGPVRLDGRIDSSATGGRVALPASLESRAPSAALDQQAIPYRVEPRGADGRPMNAFDLPPEIPDERDFDRVDTFDELANPHYEIREEIWNTPEDLVTGDGISRYGGIAYVPFWGRNAIRLGRFSIFPFAHVEGVWHSDLDGLDGGGQRGFEVMGSTGALTEYLAPGGRTKFKASLRADYRWYDEVLTDAFTYVGGVGVEQRFQRFFTVDAGIEFERAQIPDDLNTTNSYGDNHVERTSVYADARWDRFVSDDMRLEAGGSYSWIEDLSNDEHNGGDYTDLNLYARLGYAIMRHESFAYAEYLYENRDAEGASSDLDYAHEIRVGVNGILPHGRTRRLVGNAWVGYRTEKYDPSDDADSLGRGYDDSVNLFTFGGDMTYRPSPYTSGYLSFSHSNDFSAVANYNTVDTVTLGSTQNLSNRLIGRLAASWSRIEPQGDTDSNRVSLGAGLRWVVSDNFDVTTDYEFTHRFPGAGLDEGNSHRVAIGATIYVR